MTMKAIHNRIIENRLAKRLVAWALIPLCLIQAGDKSRNLIRITYGLTVEQGVAETLPYIVCCALVVAITAQAKKVARALRGQHRLLGR
ncbi:hypothetical protein [Pseudomonas sp. NBRC 111124]|uniref:hypothetical protein n=1 Tax=Pseudomonas sp. NBRC 111124 TaxID=1661039 RepID=UPI0012E1E339|nr:hypothetical protein [Pseudomonas sp. NBRC 111124]HDS0927215.1 hypothetical protein [Pseudomonas putida]